MYLLLVVNSFKKLPLTFLGELSKPKIGSKIAVIFFYFIKKNFLRFIIKYLSYRYLAKQEAIEILIKVRFLFRLIKLKANLKNHQTRLSNSFNLNN